MSCALGRSLTLVALVAVLAAALVGCKSEPPAPDRPAAPAPGVVEVTSEPAGAAIFIGKTRRAGTTPTEVEAPGAKDLELLVAKEGYRHKVVNIFVAAGARMKYHVTLEPESGTLVVSSGVLHGAKIFLNGAPAGRTPDRLDVAAGQEHLVEVRKSGFEPYREAVSVAPGDQQQVKATLLPQGAKAGPRGKLTVKSDLPALIFLDNQPLGLAPLEQQSLPAKRYILEARSGQPGQQRKRVLELVIKPNQTTEITVELKDAPAE